MSSLWCIGFDGKIFSYGTEKGGSLTRHTLRKRDKDSWYFDSTVGPSLSHDGRERRPVVCKNVFDKSQGIYTLFIITHTLEDRSNMDIFSLIPPHTNNDTLIHRGIINTDNIDTALESGIYILNGPTIIWACGNSLIIARQNSTTTFTKQKILMNKFINDSCGAYTIERVWCFDSTDDITLLFMRCINTSMVEDGASVNEWICLSLSSREGGGDIAVQLLPSQCYIPSCYGYIATCIEVCYNWSMGREDGSICMNVDLMVGTGYKQLVLLRAGIPVHCVAMESIPRNIAVLQISGCDRIDIAVSTDNHTMTAYHITSSSEGAMETQEAGRWEGVSHMLLGDIANISKDQLLLLFNDNDVEKFIVTDLAQFTVGNKSGVNDEISEEVMSESLSSAVKALRVRQQVGETHLSELELQLQHKTHLLKDTLHLLTSLPTNITSQQQQQQHIMTPRDYSLVCVLPGKVERSVRSVKGCVDDFISNSSKEIDMVNVRECWQRLLNGCWVVGVVLKNTTDSVWCQVDLALVIEDNIPVVERGHCCVMWLLNHERDHNGCNQPPNKRLKIEGEAEKTMLEKILQEVAVSEPLEESSVKPGDEFCLVTFITLPHHQTSLSAGSRLLGSLVFSWSVKGDMCDGGSVRVLGRMELPHPQLTDPSLRCGYECLNKWNGMRTLSGMRDFSLRETQDLASILATNQLTQVMVYSKYTDLSNLVDILRQRMPLPSHHILPHSIPHSNTGNKTGMDTSSHVLVETYLHVCGRGHSGTITILHRSTLSLIVVMSSLQSCLPDDITLTPHHHGNISSDDEYIKHIRCCVKTLRRELELKKKEREVIMKQEVDKMEDEGEKKVRVYESTDIAMFIALKSLGI